MFDQDKSGDLDLKELKSVLMTFSSSLAEYDSVKEQQILKSIMREVDTDNNGKIEFNEFTAMMEKLASIE